MKRNIRVILCGLGSYGQDMARIIISKKTTELVGVVTRSSHVGEDVGDVTGIDRKLGVIVSNDLDAVLSETKPDVMLDATASHTREVYPHIMKALEANVHVISMCEELANPWVHEPELAKKLDGTARKNKVSVVGTGMNPGFYLDVLPLTFAGACAEVRKIVVRRITDITHSVSTSPTIARNFGIGLSIEEAKQRLAEGKITLHVGLPETIHQLANAMGWRLTEIKEEREPVESSITLDYSPIVKVEPGTSCGCRYDGWGMVNGEVVIALEGKLVCEPNDTLEVEPFYTLWLEGKPNIRVDAPAMVGPEHSIIVGARCCNWIPYIIKAKPGLLTNMNDFPLVTCLR
ncbi:MAG: Gfo/Idh/MocA family oxidoreductase [Chloroflexota bacterium]